MYPRLRDLREDMDWSQKQLAEKLMMSQTGYSKYETGENDVPTHVLLRLAELYGTSTDYPAGPHRRAVSPTRPPSAATP